VRVASFQAAAGCCSRSAGQGGDACRQAQLVLILSQLSPCASPSSLQFYDSFSGHASMDDITEAALRALSRVQVRGMLLHL